MNKINAKTFIHALSLPVEDHRKLTAYLSDKRLTQAEKTILECWLLLRNNKTVEILQKLDGITTSDEVVQSQKDFILGITFNNSGECLKARDHIYRALQVVKKYPLRRQLFLCYNNLYVVSINLKNKNEMKKWLDLLLATETASETEELVQLGSKFSYHCFIGEIQVAGQILEILDKAKSRMTASHITAFLYGKFDFYIKQKMFQQCSDVLAEMKDYRVFQINVNYKFSKAILNHLWKDEPIYLYDQDFGPFPLMYHQLKIMKLLETGEAHMIHHYWEELRKLEPNVYLANKTYKGDICLFSLVLDKYQDLLHNVPLETITSDSTLENMTKEALLIHILKESKTPVKKETIYQLLWKEEPQDKSDFIKLAKMINKIKSKIGNDIQCSKGCYKLISKKAS